VLHSHVRGDSLQANDAVQGLVLQQLLLLLQLPLLRPYLKEVS
jgi:hypothetical protein